MSDTSPARHDETFRSLVEPHRRALFAHCYRMLGSPQDAEDALQDTLLRAWKGLPGFRSGAPIRPWLYRIATNVCLDARARRPRHLVLPGRPPAATGAELGEPIVESIWVEPIPDDAHAVADLEPEPGARLEQREALELAFVAALQLLPPRQCAVLLLRDVLGFSAREVADALDASVPAVNSALQRARETLAERLPQRSQQTVLREVGDARVRALVDRYVAAWERHDVEALRALLVEQAVFAMPPFVEWWRGRDAIAVLFGRAGGQVLRPLRLAANAQPAVAWYVRNPETGIFGASSIEVLDVEGERIAQITAFVSPELFAGFGAPMSLEDAAGISE